MYTRTVVIAKVKAIKVDGKDSEYVLDLPFKYTAINAVCLGVDVTYRLKRCVGREVLAYIGIDVKIKARLDNLTGNLGADWKVIKTRREYLKHWFVKKEDALATKELKPDGLVEIKKYDGIDKDEVTQFVPFVDEVDLEVNELLG